MIEMLPAFAFLYQCLNFRILHEYMIVYLITAHTVIIGFLAVSVIM